MHTHQSVVQHTRDLRSENERVDWLTWWMRCQETARHPKGKTLWWEVTLNLVYSTSPSANRTVKTSLLKQRQETKHQKSPEDDSWGANVYIECIWTHTHTQSHTNKSMLHSMGVLCLLVRVSFCLTRSLLLSVPNVPWWCILWFGWARKGAIISLEPSLTLFELLSAHRDNS